MAKNHGILLNEEGDLDIQVVRDTDGKIATGFKLGDVTIQNMNLIIKSHPGEFKEVPTVGVGIDNMLLDKDYLLYKHKIRQQLTAEGMQVKHLELNENIIEINANYK